MDDKTFILPGHGYKCYQVIPLYIAVPGSMDLLTKLLTISQDYFYFLVNSGILIGAVSPSIFQWILLLSSFIIYTHTYVTEVYICKESTL